MSLYQNMKNYFKLKLTFAKFPQLNFGVINTLKKFGRNDKWFLKLLYIVKVGSFQVTKNVERSVFVCRQLKANLDVYKFAFVSAKIMCFKVPKFQCSGSVRKSLHRIAAHRGSMGLLTAVPNIAGQCRTWTLQQCTGNIWNNIYTSIKVFDPCLLGSSVKLVNWSMIALW